MRVLQVSDGYPPATGGLERTVQALARELARRGHPSEVATLSHPGAPRVQVEGTDDDGPVTVRRLGGFSRHLQRFSSDPGHHFHPTTLDPALLTELSAVITAFRPDVVHAHGWMLNTCLSLRLPRGCVLVATLHDYGLNCAKKTMVQGDRLDRRCPGPTLRRCLSCSSEFYGRIKGTALTLGLVERTRRWDRISLFLPISTAVAEASLVGVSPDRYRIVSSFVEDGLAEVASRTPRPDYLPDTDIVLFVGALGEHKGLGVLGRAHRLMSRDAALVLIGSPRADTVLPKSSPNRPVLTRIRAPHDEIMAAFAAATAAVVPSRWPEPQGLVAVEAMAAGTPVVASTVGGLVDIVEPEVNGLLVPPGDAPALATALDRLLADEALRDRLGAQGRVNAQAYAAEAVLPQVLEGYRYALARARS